jgi:hypothetical protein
MDRILDALVFAPAEALFEAASDIEGSADRGRQRIGQQLSNAKVLGQMAVTFGSREVGKRAGDFLSQFTKSPLHAQPEAATPSEAPRTPQKAPKDPVAPRGAVDHVIPGYDDLSASQVVRLLDGLEDFELEEISTYERVGRSRVTIMNRIAQLQADTER